MLKSSIFMLLLCILLLSSCAGETTVTNIVTQTQMATKTITQVSTINQTVTETITSTITDTITSTMSSQPTTSTTSSTYTQTESELIILSSNVFTVDNLFTIDGEYRRLNIVAELKNNSTSILDTGRIDIFIYDSAGQMICQRWCYAFDDILNPGGTTVITETTPSLIYWESETNVFPENWYRYEINVSYEILDSSTSKSRSEAVVAQDVEVTEEEFTGDHLFTWNVVNTGETTTKNTKSYIILYDSDGSILNAQYSSISKLQPGESKACIIRFLSYEVLEYDHFAVRVYAENSP